MNNTNLSKYVSPDETIVATSGYSNQYFALDLVKAVFWILFFGVISGFTDVTIFGVFFAFLVLALAIYRKLSLAYIITNKHVIFKKGLIGLNVRSVAFGSISDILVTQSAFERMFLKSGALHVNTAGSSEFEIEMKYIPNPHGFKDLIVAQMQVGK